MSWLIMNDEVDYPVMFYPTHIVSKDKKVLPLFIGASQAIHEKAVGLYVKDEHYKLIDHTKAYIIVHDPEVTDDDIMDIEWDKIGDNNDPQKSNRKHFHIWREVEEGGTA